MQVEKWFLKMDEVPRLGQRLNALLVKTTIKSQAEDIKGLVGNLEKTSEALVSGDCWKNLLQLTLAIGNYLNDGSNRGGAWGFKFKDLKNISGTKSTDNKFSLMYFIAKNAEKAYTNFPDKAKG